MLVSSLQRNVRQGLHITQALEAGGSEQDALVAAQVSGAPTTVQNALARARRRPAAQWADLLEAAADLERRAKFGAGVGADDFACLALRWAVESAATRR